MKKKMALLMAAIMALSPVSAFAATTNSMDGTVTTAKKKTVFVEKTWENDASPNGRNILTLSNKNDKVEYAVQGSDLLIKSTTDVIRAGDTFELRLTNGAWAFANSDTSAVTLGGKQLASLGDVTLSAEEIYNWNVAVYYEMAYKAYSKDDTAANRATSPGGAQLATVGVVPADYSPKAAGMTATIWETSGALPQSYADAVTLWELAVAKVDAEYVAQGLSKIGDVRSTLLSELSKHDNTKGSYATGFTNLINTTLGTTASDQIDQVDSFKTGALDEIYNNAKLSSQAGFKASTFDKRLGAFTANDAGAYLRFGESTGPASAVDFGTNNEGFVSADGGVTGQNEIYAAIDAIELANGFTIYDTTAAAAVSDTNRKNTITPTTGTGAGAATIGTLTFQNKYSPVNTNEATDNGELPYMIRFTGSADNRVATVTVLRDARVTTTTTSNNCNYLRIPMVVRSTDDGDVKVTVAPSNNNAITGVTYTLGNVSGSGKTTTTVSDTVTARSTFELETIKISEDVISTIKDGRFTLEAPYGYFWADPSKYSDEGDGVILSSSGGLRYYERGKGALTEIKHAEKTAKGIINYVEEGSSPKTNRQKLVFNLANEAPNYEDKYYIERFDSISGSLYITGLVLLAEDYAPFDKDIMVKIKSGTPDPEIDEQSFKVGVRKDWIISLTASQPVPTLVNGRLALSKTDLKTPSNNDDFDGWHKTSKVTFKENVEASWWEERDTELTLPDGVKYIQVKIADANKDDEFQFSNGLNLNGTFYAVSSEGNRTGYVKVSGNKLTLTDLKLRANKKAEFTIQPWVSIESGFEGDITMTATGSGVPYEVAPVVIAKAVSPITIDTEVTDVKIGYQWQKVADFTINETGAGRLLKDKEVTLSIDDSISNDEIYFAPDSVVEKSGNLSFTKPAVTGGHITFMLDRQSNGTAGAIKFSNVYVKIDRTVPESNNHPYKIVAHGDGIAANYAKTYKSYEPVFSTKGIGADYLNVVTAATDKPGVLSNTVRVSIGSDVVLVGRDNPQEIQMDTAAYISAESNSTMVPVRFVSVALGIPEGQIQWDEENRTVTINYTNTTVQMKAGSDQLTINGVTTTMYSPDVPPKKVTVEMKDNRSFLPFRQLGYALGVPVAWDDETRTAIYNAPEDLNTSSSVVADAE